MNKFMDLEEANLPVFTTIFRELEYLYRVNQGLLFNLYYKYIQTNFRISCLTRRWEYPWAIISSQIRGGEKILDAGCGGSPLLLYLYRKGCDCYGIDNEFSYEITPPSSNTRKYRIVQRLSKSYPFNLLTNPHGERGLSKPDKTLGFNINYIKGNLINMPFEEKAFDRVFCISVIEHLSPEDMLSAAREFYRVLKHRGLAIMTADCWGTGLKWQDFIKASGLNLYGESDFENKAVKKDTYDVVGFVLRKE